MIPRYTRPEMGKIFADQNRFDAWLAVVDDALVWHTAKHSLAALDAAVKAELHRLRELH